jgi:hypothetical protein
MARTSKDDLPDDERGMFFAGGLDGRNHIGIVWEMALQTHRENASVKR